jgi:hypothetical protein
MITLLHSLGDYKVQRVKKRYIRNIIAYMSIELLATQFIYIVIEDENLNESLFIIKRY